MPWIMLQPTSNHSTEAQIFNPSENKFYVFPLPEARWTTICAAVKGWVATVGYDSRIHLLDLKLFTTQPRRITLPSLHAAVGAPPVTDADRRFLKKLCLPACPIEEPDAMAVAIYGTRYQLAFLRFRSRSWTTIACSPLSSFDDVVFCKGMFYAVAQSGDVMKLDLCRRQTVKIASAPTKGSAAPLCLVESDGDLLQVMQCKKTKLRRVFKLDFGSGQWTLVTSLGERSLFLEDYDTKDAMVVYSLDEDKEIEIRDMAESVINIPMTPLWISPFLWWQKS